MYSFDLRSFLTEVLVTELEKENYDCSEWIDFNIRTVFQGPSGDQMAKCKEERIKILGDKACIFGLPIGP